MVKITFVGDIMCQKQLLPIYQTTQGYDFNEIFEGTKEFFGESDLVIGNLETPISKEPSEYTTQKYNFSSPYEFAEAVYESGIKCVATANNHCLDRGIGGLDRTIQYLDEIGILHTGTYKSEKEKKPLIIEAKDMKIGVLSYTYGTNAFSNHNYLNRKNKYKVNLFQNQELSNPITRFCYHHRNIVTRVYNKLMRIIFREKVDCQVYERKENDLLCKRRLLKEIKQIKEAGAEIIVMCMHAGGQYNKEPLKSTKKLSRFLLKHGVNIIAGSHEHVVHDGEFDEINENKISTYSLGNYCTVYGLYEEPYDEMANYSIAWNVYVDNENSKINKTTFSVLKTVETERKGIQTVLLYDLINKEKDEEKRKNLIEDMKKIAYKFAKIEYKEIQKEYQI